MGAATQAGEGLVPVSAYQTGMDQLMDRHADLLGNRRIGLVAHPASINRAHPHSATLLRERLGDRLTCLLGPEHGFHGRGAAGEEIKNDVHPEWRIPVYSLYGDTERAINAIAERVDCIVFDLQDLAVRCYTYVHTLRQLMEAAATHRMHMVVTDRASPFAGCVDGPMLDPAFESIVAPVPAPMVYGMTPGETARWLKVKLDVDLALDVVPVGGYQRQDSYDQIWPTWHPPSPAIRSWECAMCYAATVFTEALPQLDCARATSMAFRVLRADWLDIKTLVDALRARALPGVSFVPCEDVSALPGIQICVTDVERYRPVQTGVALLYAIQQIHGPDCLWKDERANTTWFDRLMGTDRVRRMLQDGETPNMIAADWERACAPFIQERAAALLYGE